MMSDKNKKSSSRQDRQMRHLSQSIRLREEMHPAIVRGTIVIICCAMAAFITWASVVNIHEVARTPGEVVPSGYEQVVQHLEGGIVSDILVNDGTVVKKGQVLLRINGTGVREDLARALAKKEDLSMLEERLRAFLDNRKPVFTKDEKTHDAGMVKDQKAFFSSMVTAQEKEKQVMTDQIRQKKQAIGMLETRVQSVQGNYDIASELYQRRLKLNKQGILSDVKLLETQQQYNDLKGQIDNINSQISMARMALTEYRTRLQSLAASENDSVNQKLNDVLSNMAQNDEEIKKLQKRVDRLNVRAPVDGIVKGLAVNTVGSVVQPAQKLMEIVPTNEKLIVSLKIPPRYAGHIKPGQPVQVKISSFDFARYGAVKGKLTFLSATTFEGARGERFYQGRVTLDRDYAGGSAANRILPGMTVMADIITGKKTILEYLLKPIRVAMTTAFTER